MRIATLDPIHTTDRRFLVHTCCDGCSSIAGSNNSRWRICSLLSGIGVSGKQPNVPDGFFLGFRICTTSVELYVRDTLLLNDYSGGSSTRILSLCGK